MKEYSRVKAVVSLDAILHNFEVMHRNIQKGTKIIGVIKADGYGHGALSIARLMEEKDYIWGFATATAQEALALRENGIRKPLMVLGYVFEEDREALAQARIRMPVFRMDTARELGELARKLDKQISIHIAVDTGMSRIGFLDEEKSVAKIQKICQMHGLQTEGIFTHFARADETDKSPAYRQLQRFSDFLDKLYTAGVNIPMKHCSNSAGILRLPEANYNAVRAGISIYGVYPSDEVEKEPVKLLPAMELKSHVTHVKKLPSGVEVSYGGTWTTRRETTTATIPVGYADGYPRSLSNRGYVLIHGKKAPILGRICMDQFMVDVTDIPDVFPETEVTLFGSDNGAYLSVDELGRLSGRFPYEFLCGISPRVPRIYIKDKKRCCYGGTSHETKVCEP